MVLSLLLVAAACGDNLAAPDAGPDPDASPVDSEPDYDRAFPQDRVARLDVTIAPADWAAMNDDMTEMLGAFGAGGGPDDGGGGGGGGGGGPEQEVPPELYAACDGLAAGDPCSAVLMTMEITGTCTQLEAGLACLPEGMGGGGGGGGLILEDPIYVEATVTADGETWSHVGIRFKGNSSLSSTWMSGIGKLPFRIKFDEFEDTYPETSDQRFFGFKTLSLSNAWSDPTLVRDKLGTEVFVEAELAAPATAFYQLYVDTGSGPTYFGLYTAIEVPSDGAFLKTHYGDNDGNLYKPDGAGASFATYDDESMGKENNEDVADYTDVRGLFDALHADRTDPAAWRAGLEQWFDVELFLRWLALNTVIEDWDTYGNMTHNYYLYAPIADGRLRWIPWDHTFAFNAGGTLGFMAPLPLDMATVSEQWPLIRYVVDDPVYRAKYDEYVAEVTATVYEPVHAQARFEAARALIEPYVIGAQGEQPGYTHLQSSEEFEQAHAALLEHPAARASAVEAYLAR